MTDEIHVRMVDGTIRCAACGDAMTVRTIRMLLRQRPGGPFDPICADCADAMIGAAAVAMAPVEFVLEYLPE